MYIVCVVSRKLEETHITRVENVNGLCAYIIYMQIALFPSKPSIIQSVRSKRLDTVPIVISYAR